MLSRREMSFVHLSEGDRAANVKKASEGDKEKDSRTTAKHREKQEEPLSNSL